MDDNDFEREIKEAFLQEAQDLLERTELKFLELEKNPEDLEILDAICRLAHNFKGSGKAVGFDGLSDFCHQMENLLVKMKDGSVKTDPTVVDLLLQCSDQMKSNIETLLNDMDAEIDNSELTSKLEDIIQKPEKVLVDVKNEIINTQDSVNDDFTKKIEEELAKISFDEEFKDERQDLGTILINSGKVKSEDVERAAKLQKSKLGEILVEQGLASYSDVESALKIQKNQAKKSGHKPEEYIRVALSKIDNLLNYFGEQVILQSALEHIKHDIDNNKDTIIKTISQLSKITHDLQQTAIALRMLSIKGLFSKMERVVRDTSRSVGKEIEFITTGENNELDKTIIEAIVDPLLHMVRNSVDHGIEISDERISIGKEGKGKIWLNAYNKGGFFYIEVKDDGRGLDKEKIIKKAVSLGMINENNNLSDKEIYNMIFSSGFSTKDQATDISGRGVGMDVVKTAISNLKGTCEIDSKKGVGTTFTIRLPLTLAIFNGMIVRIGNGNYVFPNSDIEEAVTIKTSDVRIIDNKNSVVNMRGEVIPVVDVNNIVLNKSNFKKDCEPKDITALVASKDSKKYALMVDELISQQRVVHKNIGEELKNTPAVAGGTILGDGRVALILETGGLIDYYKCSK